MIFIKIGGFRQAGIHSEPFGDLEKPQKRVHQHIQRAAHSGLREDIISAEEGRSFAAKDDVVWPNEGNDNINDRRGRHGDDL